MDFSRLFRWERNTSLFFAKSLHLTISSLKSSSRSWLIFLNEENNQLVNLPRTAPLKPLLAVFFGSNFGGFISSFLKNLNKSIISYSIHVWSSFDFLQLSDRFSLQQPSFWSILLIWTTHQWNNRKYFYLQPTLKIVLKSLSLRVGLLSPLKVFHFEFSQKKNHRSGKSFEVSEILPDPRSHHHLWFDICIYPESIEL